MSEKKQNLIRVLDQHGLFYLLFGHLTPDSAQ